MTAVEYLIKEFSEILGPIQTTSMQNILMMDAMKKAKEMEKLNLDVTYHKGVIDGRHDTATF